MLEFSRVSRWFRIADGYTLRYNRSGRNWRVCAPGSKVLGTVGSLTEAERLANQHAEDEAAAEAAIAALEEDPPFDGVKVIRGLPTGDFREVEVRGYSADDIEHAAAEQGVGTGAAMLSLAMGAPYTDLVNIPTEPDLFEYLTERHESAMMVTEADDDIREVTMQPCQCLSPTGEIEDGSIVATSCGGEVPSKRGFKPGHDAKLKSTLIKAHRSGGTLIIRDGGARTEANAMELAKARGWERFLTDAKPRKPRARANDGEAIADDRGELNPESLREPKGASQPARVKVRGAWKDGYVTKVEPGETASSPQTITVTYQNAKKKHVEVTLLSDSDKLQLG